jgi:ribosome modulation factor
MAKPPTNTDAGPSTPDEQKRRFADVCERLDADDVEKATDRSSDQKRRLDHILEGARSRSAGRPKDSCPYPLNTPERDAWIEGFDGEPADHGPDLPMGNN